MEDDLNKNLKVCYVKIHRSRNLLFYMLKVAKSFLLLQLIKILSDMDPITFSFTLINALKFGGGVLGGRFINKSLDKVFKSEDDFYNELVSVIKSAMREFEEKYPQKDENGKMAFYYSSKVIAELSKYRLMNQELYNPDSLLEVLRAEEIIIPPTKEQIEEFYKIFTDKINQNEKLKKLEIKSTFQDEIFLISDGIKSLNRNIEKVLSSYTSDLNFQWKDRIDTYVETLKQFKPQTALDLLNRLEQSFSQSQTKPTEDFLANIDFQKGICYMFLKDEEQSCKSFIAAYRKQAANSIFKEKALLSYFTIKDFQKAQILTDELLQSDEYNPVACAVNILLAKEEDSKILISSIPHIVKNNRLFQNILRSYYHKGNQYGYLELLEREGVLSYKTDIKPIDVNINTYYDSIYLIEIALTSFIRAYNYIGFAKIEVSGQDNIVFLNGQLKKTLLATENSEIEKETYSLKALYSFTNYLLTKDKKNILEVNEYYKKDKSTYLGLIYANALQIEGEIDLSLEIIDSETKRTFELSLLEAFCYYKKEGSCKYVEYLKKCISAINKIYIGIEAAYINAIFILKYFGAFNNLNIEDFYAGKEFENPKTKLFIKTIVQILKNESIKDFENSLIEFIDDYSSDRAYLLFIADTCFYGKEYHKAVELYKKILVVDQESRQLIFYVEALYELREDGETLLSILSTWRKTFSYNESLLRMEAELCNLLLDYSRCLEVCNHLLSKMTDDEAILTLKLVSLNLLKQTTDGEFVRIATHLSKIKFRITSNIGLVVNILFENELYQEGFELLNNHWEVPELHGLYYFSYLQFGSRPELKIFKDPEVIDWGHFVRYEIDSKEVTIEMNLASPTPIQNKLLGKKVGDTIKMKRQMSGTEDEIVIKKIITKWVVRIESIYQEAKNPYSGLPMESFEFKSDKPGDMLEQLKSIIGGDSDRVEQMNKMFSDYYEFKMSFTEIAFKLFNSDYLETYYNLINEKQGIKILPVNAYPIREFDQSSSYVIDYTTLFMLYQISHVHGITFPNKFIISKYIVETLKRKLQSLKTGGFNHKIICVPDNLVTTKYLENPIECQIEYLEGLIDWIIANCDVQVSKKIVNLRMQDQDAQSRLITDYISNTIVLVEDNANSILLTDDFLYYRFGMLPLESQTSSEIYIKSILGENHKALDEYIQNRYDGFSYTFEQISNEFEKKISSSPNKYDFIVSKTNLTRIDHIIDMVVYIVSHRELSSEVKRSEIELVLNAVNGGFNNPELSSNFAYLLLIKCHSLQTEQSEIIIPLISKYLKK